MKKTTVIFAALLLATTGALAEEAAEDLTIAAAEVSAKAVWIETDEDAQRHLQEDLAAKTKELDEVVNAKLEEKLAEQLAQKLGL